MISILKKMWEAIWEFLNSPRVKEILKRILWAIVNEVANMIKDDNNEQKTDSA